MGRAEESLQKSIKRLWNYSKAYRYVYYDVINVLKYLDLKLEYHKILQVLRRFFQNGP